MHTVSAKAKRQFFCVALVRESFTIVPLVLLLPALLVQLAITHDPDVGPIGRDAGWSGIVVLLLLAIYYLRRKTLPRYRLYIAAAQRTGLSYNQMNRYLSRLDWNTQLKLLSSGRRQDFEAARPQQPWP